MRGTRKGSPCLFLVINNFHVIFVENFSCADARAAIKNCIFVTMILKRDFFKYTDNQIITLPCITGLFDKLPLSCIFFTFSCFSPACSTGGRAYVVEFQNLNIKL